MGNKKGVSAVIATVLIILITVAAVSILWRFVMPLITGNIDVGTKCFDTMDQLRIVNDIYTCKNTGNISIQVSRGARNFTLLDIQIIVRGASGNKKTFEVLNDITTLNSSNIELPNQNEDRVYVINTSSVDKPDSVQIAPMVKIKNSKEPCEAIEAVTLRNC